jgi:hypothetical protein
MSRREAGDFRRTDDAGQPSRYPSGATVAASSARLVKIGARLGPAIESILSGRMSFACLLAVIALYYFFLISNGTYAAKLNTRIVQSPSRGRLCLHANPIDPQARAFRTPRWRRRPQAPQFHPGTTAANRTLHGRTEPTATRL